MSAVDLAETRVSRRSAFRVGLRTLAAIAATLSLGSSVEAARAQTPLSRGWTVTVGLGPVDLEERDGNRLDTSDRGWMGAVGLAWQSGGLFGSAIEVQRIRAADRTAYGLLAGSSFRPARSSPLRLRLSAGIGFDPTIAQFDGQAASPATCGLPQGCASARLVATSSRYTYLLRPAAELAVGALFPAGRSRFRLGPEIAYYLTVNPGHQFITVPSLRVRASWRMAR